MRRKPDTKSDAPSNGPSNACGPSQSNRRCSTPAPTTMEGASRAAIRIRAAAILSALASLAVLVSLLAAASHSVSSAASEGYQPEPPIAAGFFYPWYPSHWAADGVFPFTNYTPSLGLYSSMDDAVIAEQLALGEQAHLEAFISSWWEQGETTDVALQHILSVTEETGSPIRWAAYYEPEGYSDPDVGKIVGDLQYLNERAFNSPAYLRVGGVPVVFVYGQGSEGCSMIDRWSLGEQFSEIDVYVVLKVFDGYAECSSQPDSWHEYNPTLAFNHALPHSVSVSPGFWKSGEGTVLERDLADFEYALKWMVVTDATWQLITTWNEWLEGTTVEPAQEYGLEYVDVLCRTLPGPSSCTPSSVLTPTPTAQPTPVEGSVPTQVATRVHGDVDCNEDVDSLDALKILTSLVAPSSVQSGTCFQVGFEIGGYMVGDVDCDGTVDSIDGLMILRFVAGLDVIQQPSCPSISSSV